MLWSSRQLTIPTYATAHSLTVKVRRELPRERVDRREEYRTLARMREVVRVHNAIEAVETARVPVEVGWPLMFQGDDDVLRVIRWIIVFAVARCQREQEIITH